MNLCLIGEFKMEHSRQLLGHPTCNHFLDLLINNLIAIAECNEEPGSENCQNHVPDGVPAFSICDFIILFYKTMGTVYIESHNLF